MHFLLVTFLCVAQPDAPKKEAARPTTQQVQAELSVARAEADTARKEADKVKAEAKADNFYTFLTTFVLTVTGAGGAIGAFAKWWASSRIERVKLEHQQKMDEKAATHAQQLELAKFQAESRKAANDDDLAKLRADFILLEKRCQEEERKCADGMARLNERVAKAEANEDALRQQLMEQREQLVILRATNKQSPFAGWTMNFDGRIIDVTPAGERQVLVPMGLTRDKVEMQRAEEVWPPELRRLLVFLDDEARVRPGHIAGALNVKFHPKLPPVALVKCLATYVDGRAYGVGSVVVPMTAFVDLPDDLADLRPVTDAATPNRHD